MWTSHHWCCEGQGKGTKSRRFKYNRLLCIIMKSFKLKREVSKHKVMLECNDMDALIFSEYAELDTHSKNLRDYLNNSNIKTGIISSNKKKGIGGSCCDLLVERVVFFIGGTVVAWSIGKYLDWLFKESKKIIKKHHILFKNRKAFLVRCIISVYNKKNETLKEYVYTGELNEVIDKIKSDFKVK